MKGRVARDPKVKVKLAVARQSAVTRRLMARDAAANRGDTAAVNVKMIGSRGRSLNAEISRNVKSQKSAARQADKARNRQFKSEQSRAKQLLKAHSPAISKAKNISRSQVEKAFKAQPPSIQIKALKKWVKDNRHSATRR